jgi:hypothetical protein
MVVQTVPISKPKNLGKFIPISGDILLVCKGGNFFYMHKEKTPELYYEKKPEEKVSNSTKWTEKLNENNGVAFQLSQEMSARADTILKTIILPIIQKQKKNQRKSKATSRHDARVFPLGKHQTSTR